MINEKLFRDVLNEGAVGAADFESAVLKKTVATARRARRVRIATRSTAILAVIAFAFLQLRSRDETAVAQLPTSTTPPQKEASYMLVRSQPFAGVLRTSETVPFQPLQSSSNTFAILRNADYSNVEMRLLTDEELLAFFKGKAVALVKDGARSSELIFVERD